jgi:hypothetical protein
MIEVQQLRVQDEAERPQVPGDERCSRRAVDVPNRREDVPAYRAVAHTVVVGVVPRLRHLLGGRGEAPAVPVRRLIDVAVDQKIVLQAVRPDVRGHLSRLPGALRDEPHQLGLVEREVHGAPKRGRR